MIQKQNFLIPSPDMTKCEDCSPLSNCNACRYFYYNRGNGINYDHTYNPTLIANDEMQHIKKYCTSCSSTNFVNVFGVCQQCDLYSCAQCYQGTLSGPNKQYTLDFNFLYLSETIDNNLFKDIKIKCNYCNLPKPQQQQQNPPPNQPQPPPSPPPPPPPISMMINYQGLCANVTQTLTKLDGNCTMWKQVKDNTLESSYRCLECGNKYGLDVTSTREENMRCTIPKEVNPFPNCLGFYGQKLDGGNYLIMACQKCAPGYTPSIEFGCISCIDGYSSSAEMNITQTLQKCTSCSRIAKSGFNFTHYIWKSRPMMPGNQLIQLEQNYNLDKKPHCEICSGNYVYKKCLEECKIDCFSCTQDNDLQIQNCDGCKGKKYMNKYNVTFWPLQNTFDDKNKCNTCPRYTDFCQLMGPAEKSTTSPYFNAKNTNNRIQEIKSIICKTPQQICKDQKQVGLIYNCPSDLNDLSKYDFVVYKNPKNSKCLICPKDNPTCKRTYKIQKMIDCRQSLTENELNLSSNQNKYYQDFLKDNTVNLEQPTIIADVVLLSQQERRKAFTIDFDEFDSYPTSFDNQLLVDVLYQEGFTHVEYEVLVIPDENKSFLLKNGTTITNVNSCIIQSDLCILSRIAYLVPGIEDVSFRFKPLYRNKTNYSERITFFLYRDIALMNFYTFNFENMNFFPLQSIDDNFNPFQFGLTLKDSIFLSTFILNNVTFASGLTPLQQIENFDIYKSNCFAFIVITNSITVISNNVQFNDFQYGKKITPYAIRFAKTLNTEVKIIFNNLKLYNCQIYDAPLFGFSGYSVKYIFNGLFIELSSFINSQLLSDHVEEKADGDAKQTDDVAQEKVVNEYTAIFKNIEYKFNYLSQSSILFLENIKTLTIDNFQMISCQAVSLTDLSLFQSNVFNVQNFIVSKYGNIQSEYQNTRFFQFPIQSDSVNPGNAFFKGLKFIQTTFKKSTNFIINLTPYVLKQSSYGDQSFIQVTISDLQLSEIVSSGIENTFAISIEKAKSVAISSSYIEKSKKINFIQLSVYIQLNINYGGCYRDVHQTYQERQNNFEQLKQKLNQSQDQDLDDFKLNDEFDSGFCLLLQRPLLVTIIENFNVYNQYTFDDSLFEVQNDNQGGYPNAYAETQYLLQTYFLKYNQNKIDLDQSYIGFFNCKFMNNIVYNKSDNKLISPIKMLVEDKTLIVFSQTDVFNQMHFTLLKYLYVISSSFLHVNSIYSYVYIDQMTADNFQSSITQNGFYVNSKDLKIENSSFKNSILVYTKYQAPIYGGFFKAYINELNIINTSFSNSNSTYGGALYVIGLGQFKLNVKSSNFSNIMTTINKEYGYGGAFYIDSTQTESADINFETAKFENILAKTSGAIIFLSSGQYKNQITLDMLNINNVFAPSGSLIKYNFLSKTSIITLKNSKLKSDQQQIQAYIQLIQSSQLTQSVNQKYLNEFFNLFYLVVGQYGTANFINNSLINLNNFQGFFHVTSSNVNDEGNFVINTPFTISPFIYAQLGDQNKYQLKGSRYLNNQYNGFIYIQNYLSEQNSYIYIQDGNAEIFDLRMSQIRCLGCYSIIQLNEVYGQMSQSYFKNNAYFKYGLVNIQQKSPSQFLRQLQSTQKSLFMFIQTTFIENSGETGGAIYSVYKQLYLINCLLYKNAVANAGAIYFKSDDYMRQDLIIQGSTIQKNNATYFGGIQSVNGFVSIMDDSKINNNLASNQINNIVQYPTKMNVYIVHESKTKEKIKTKLVFDEKDNKITINGWSSNKSINGYLFVELLDDNNDYFNQTPYEMDKDKISFANINLVSQILYNTTSESDGLIIGAKSVQYSYTDKGYSFNSIVLRQDQGKSMFLMIRSPDIKIPIYDINGKQNGFRTDYSIKIEIKMRECIIGEQYQSTLKECVSCPEGTYSLTASSLDCKTCPYQDGVKECEGRDKIIISQGYWRPSQDSDSISECFNFKTNCLGGYGAGNNICSEGHIGALCESCDIYGEFWGEAYSSNGLYKCGKCSEVSRNAFKIVFIIFYNLLAILFSVNSTQTSAKNQLLGLYVQKLGFISRNSILKKEETSIILKIFTTYIQLISVITTFKLDIPTILGDITGNIGNPIETMSYSLDCSLVQIQNSIPLVYFRLLWSLSLPLVFFVVFMVLFVSYLTITKQKSDCSMHWIAFTYIFLSLQPSIITQFIQIVSCRYISGEYYMKSDVSYQCFTENYKIWSLVLAVPVLLCWSIVIPAFLFFQLYINRHKLSQMMTKKKFGFLFNEYKQQSYFWEMIKVVMKTLVIIFINMYDDNIQIKGILVLLVICCYWLLTHRFQPYIDLKYNKLDKYSTTTVLISIILSIFIYDNPYIYLIWGSYLLLIVINIVCLVKMIKIIILGYSKKFENDIRQCIDKINEKFPFLSKIFNIQKVSDKRIIELWAILRIHARHIGQKRRALIESKINLQSSIRSQDNLMAQSFNSVVKKQNMVNGNKQEESNTAFLKLNVNTRQKSSIFKHNQNHNFVDGSSETQSIVQSVEMTPQTVEKTPQSQIRLVKINRKDSAQESQRSQNSDVSDPFDKNSIFNSQNIQFTLNKVKKESEEYHDDFNLGNAEQKQITDIHQQPTRVTIFSKTNTNDNILQDFSFQKTYTQNELAKFHKTSNSIQFSQAETKKGNQNKNRFQTVNLFQTQTLNDIPEYEYSRKSSTLQIQNDNTSTTTQFIKQDQNNENSESQNEIDDNKSKKQDGLELIDL